MIARFLMIVTIGGTLAVGPPAQDDAKQESEKLQGIWTVARARRDGELDNSLKGATITISGDKFISKNGETVVAQGTWKIDPTKEPKTIDIRYTDGPEKNKRVFGIYAFKEESWVLLLAAAGKDRPASFEKEMQEGQTYLLLSGPAPPPKK
jgi:uncharacterized protein (TIGR03067 family)